MCVTTAYVLRLFDIGTPLSILNTASCGWSTYFVVVICRSEMMYRGNNAELP